MAEFTLEQAMNANRRSKGITLFFLTSALDGAGGQRHTSAALPPRRDPLCRRFGGPMGQCGRVRKISPAPGFDSRNVQPVASRYTDWAIPADGGDIASLSIWTTWRWAVGFHAQAASPRRNVQVGPQRRDWHF